MNIIRDKLSGNEAAALAMKQINPGVVAAFPITPSTEIPQYFSSFVSMGAVDTEFIPVESEHSAMSACIGAQASGVRAMTATSANGLALMWEMLYIASSLRLPIVMACVNRALSGPLNIHCDHSDAMGARDSGWIQLYCENNQEVYDNMLMAVKIGEHPDVNLPVMVCQDGFITSHSVENIELFDDKAVSNYIGGYKPLYSLLDGDRHVSVGPLDLQSFYFEHKRQQLEAIQRASGVIGDTAKAFGGLSGRSYSFIEEYPADNAGAADVALIALGSAAGTVRHTVDLLRKEGINASLVKIRVYRPFPADAIAEALKKYLAVGVMDRASSPGAIGGPVFTDVAGALYSGGACGGRPAIINFIYGLGGRDIKEHHVRQAFGRLLDIARGGEKWPTVNYLGLRD